MAAVGQMLLVLRDPPCPSADLSRFSETHTFHSPSYISWDLEVTGGRIHKLFGYLVVKQGSSTNTG